MKNKSCERAVKLTHNKISVNSEKQQHSTSSFKSDHKRKKGAKKCSKSLFLLNILILFLCLEENK